MVHDPNLDYQLKNLPDLPALSDFDYFAVQDVSNVTVPLCRFSVAALRANFGQLPPTAELEEGAIDLPTWRLEGFAGGWTIYIDTIVEDAQYYLLYYFEPESGEYVAINYIPESRLDAAAGPLSMTVRAPDHDPPRWDYRVFKVQTITADYKSPLSDAKDARTILYLSPDFTPAAPTLETSGYPIISLAPMPDGGFGYTITMKINAATGEKDYIKYYELQRASDDGAGSFPASPSYVRLPDHEINVTPAPPSFIYNNTDRALEPGNKYRFRVRGVATNGVPSAWGAVQELTLTGDTTAPDAPVFTVTEVSMGLRVEFNKATQGGAACPDWKAWRLQVKKGEGDWEYIGTEDGFFPNMFYQHDIDGTDMASSFKFRAKAVDYSNNESAWTGESDAATANKVTGDSIDDRTVNAQHVALKALTYEEIADLTLRTANIANLQITETKIGNDAVTTPKVKANNIIGSHILFGTMEGGHFKALTITGDKMAANSVSLSKLNFTPLTSAGATGEIVATILASGEGIRITGGFLAIDSNTTFTSDVEIQGTLTSGGGLQTAASGTRLRLGTHWSGYNHLDFYYNTTQKAYMRMSASGDCALSLAGTTYTTHSFADSNGMGVFDSTNAMLVGMSGTGDMVANRHVAFGYDVLAGTGALLQGATTRINSSGQGLLEDLFLPTGGGVFVNAVQVVGGQGGAVSDATDAASTMARLNELLAILRTHGLIDT